MPIGRSPRIRAAQIRSYLTIEAYGVTQGEVVSVVDDGGTMKLLPCSSNLYADTFYGFADATTAQGTIPTITGRGSRVTPLVKNDDPLVIGVGVWLSDTAGRVVQTPPSSGTILRVGTAVTTTEMVLATDAKVSIG